MNEAEAMEQLAEWAKQDKDLSVFGPRPGRPGWRVVVAGEDHENSCEGYGPTMIAAVQAAKTDEAFRAQ